MVGGGDAAVLLQRMPGAAESAMARFIAWLSDSGRFDGTDYEQLWVWSADHPEQFGAALWDFFGVRSSSRPGTVLADRSMPGATWFPGVRLNYAEQVFSQATLDRAALAVTAEGRDPVEVSWPELRRSVAGLAASLRAWGVKPGDRVGAYLPNIPEAVVGPLAAARVPAGWGGGAPGYGAPSGLDRFAHIEPVG